jgi:hypothetical protein
VAFQLQGDHERSVTDFRSVADTYAQREVLFDHLGYSLLQLRRAQEANLAFFRANRINETFESRLKLGWSRFLSPGGASSSLSEFSKAIQLAPDRFEGYLLRAYASFESRRSRAKSFDNEVNDIQAAVERQPDLALVRFHAARILSVASKTRAELKSEVIAHLEAAARLGWSRKDIETALEFAELRDEAEFRHLLQGFAASGTTPQPTLHEIAVSLPPLLQAK